MDIYVFKQYDPVFQEIFITERDRVDANTTPNIIIEHIGSTAIGLGGKGVIDIIVGAKKSEDINILKENLSLLGYSYFEPGSMEGRDLFVFTDDNQQRYHLHLVLVDSRYMKEALFFREYLKENNMVSQDYENLKRKILALPTIDEKKYRELKNPYIRRIIDENLY